MGAGVQRALALSLLGWTALAGCVESRPAPLTRTYLVSVIEPCAWPFEGFDLDRRVSTGASSACFDREDTTSPSGRPGIDNTLGWVGCASAPPRDVLIAPYLEQIAAGEYLLLVEVSDIDSFDSDAHVDVRVFGGRANGAVLLEDGMAIAGQTFGQVGDDLSLTTGDIVGGVVRVAGVVFPLTATYADGTATFTLLDAQLRASIADDALLDGEVGGRVAIDELIAIEPSVADWIYDLADLDPDPVDPTVCHGASYALGFAAVQANPEAE